MFWEIYYEKNKNRSVRPLYAEAISIFYSTNRDPSSHVAMDLGCGVGIEVLDLLQRGFTVHAVDQEAQAIELVKVKASQFSERLYTDTVSFEKMKKWPKVDFFYSFHALPFCDRSAFEDTVQRSIEAVVPGGIYVVSFFGPEDEWVISEKVRGMSGDKLKEKLQNYDILRFVDDKQIGKTVLNEKKMWHNVQAIARRKK